MGTVRRRYTDEFKQEAVGLLTSNGRPLSQIAGELGIPAARGCGLGATEALEARRDRRGAPTQAAIPPAGMDLAIENARLRRENERLRMERELDIGFIWGVNS